LYRGAIIGGVGTLLSLPVIAATMAPQPLLNAAIKNAGGMNTHAIAGELMIHVTERSLRGGTPTMDASVEGSADLRMVRPQNGIADTQGTLRLKKASFNGLTTDQPISVDWKQAGDSVSANPSIDPMTGAFIAGQAQNIMDSVNVEQLALLQDILSSTLGAPTDISAISPAAMRIAEAQPLTVRRVEKRYKTDDGVNMIRLRAGVNPAIVNAMQAAELAGLDRTAKDYWTKRAEVLARYRTLRAQLNSVFMAININADTQIIDRIEVGAKNVTPVKECTTNTAGKEVCRTTGNRTVTLNSGFFVR
jgi:hypothetical protein